MIIIHVPSSFGNEIVLAGYILPHTPPSRKRRVPLACQTGLFSFLILVHGIINTGGRRPVCVRCSGHIITVLTDINNVRLEPNRLIKSGVPPPPVVFGRGY